MLSVADHEYRTGVVVNYAACGHCGSLTQHPMPDAATLAGFYVAGYHSFNAEGRLAELKHRSRLAGLKPFLSDPGDPLLDFGCGAGGFLFAAAKTISNPLFGFEIAATDAVEHSSDGRVTIVRGSVDRLLEEIPRVKVVTMNHVIEHLQDPQETLCRLKDRLLPAGVFEGQTPNPASLERRVFGRRWSGFHAPRHTVVFSAEGLRALFARIDMAGCEVRPAFNPAGIAVSLLSLKNSSSRGGSIPRAGLGWLSAVLAACALYPVDRVSGAPGMIDFVSHRAPEGENEGAR